MKNNNKYPVPKKRYINDCIAPYQLVNCRKFAKLFPMVKMNSSIYKFWMKIEMKSERYSLNCNSWINLVVFSLSTDIRHGTKTKFWSLQKCTCHILFEWTYNMTFSGSSRTKEEEKGRIMSNLAKYLSNRLLVYIYSFDIRAARVDNVPEFILSS